MCLCVVSVLSSGIYLEESHKRTHFFLLLLLILAKGKRGLSLQEVMMREKATNRELMLFSVDHPEKFLCQEIKSSFFLKGVFKAVNVLTFAVAFSFSFSFSHFLLLSGIWE